MTSSPLAPPADPTDVVGTRIGAYVIDSLLGLVVLGAVLLLGNFHFYERTSPPEGRTAVATCDEFNQIAQVDENTDPPPFIDEQGRSNETTVCIPYAGDTIYFNPFDLMGTFFIIQALTYLPYLLNMVLLQGITGATLGKRALGLRVVGEDGEILGFWRQALRTLLLLTVDGQFFIGLILACITQGHRRLGDMAAKSYVVRKESVGTPIVVPPKPGAYLPPPGYGAPGYGAPGYGPPGYPAPPPPAPAASADGPHWDREREAFIRYDRDRSEWLEWSDSHQTWGPISR